MLRRDQGDMRLMQRPTRRLALTAGGFVAASALLPARWSGLTGGSAQAAEGENENHGLSVFGDLALPPDFKFLPYVNPAAPKGGQIALQTSATGGNQNFTTFDTLN